MSENEAYSQSLLYPLIGWEVTSSERRNCMLIRLFYLENPEDDVERPHVALLHSLSAAQARTLALDLLNEVARVEP